MVARSTLTTSLLLFCGMALFGSATPLSKLVVRDFPVFTASLFRVTLGAIVLLPFLAGGAAGIARLTRRDWIVVSAIALVGMFGFTVFLLLGMQRVPGVVGAIVMSAAPAVTAAAAVLLLGEHWNRRKAAAITLSVAGIVLVNVAGRLDDVGVASTGGLVVGSLLVFAAVCCEAGYTLLGKATTKRLDPALTVFLASLLAIPLFAVPVLVLEWGDLDTSRIEAGAWLALFLWGGGTLGLGSILWYAGIRRTSGSVAAGFMGVMPVSALVLSYVLLDEPVRGVHLLGFAIVFAAVVLMSREHARGEHG